MLYTAALIVLNAVRLILEVFYVILIIRAILSWLPISGNAFTNFIYAVTEPVLRPVRNLLMRSSAVASLPIDLSFLVVLVVIQILIVIL